MQSRLLFGADRKFDGLYFVIALVLAAVGIALIFSARYASDVATPYYQRQMLWMALSLVLFFVVVRIPLRFYEVFAYPIFGLSIVLLIVVLFKGRGAGGAVRWFDRFISSRRSGRNSPPWWPARDFSPPPIGLLRGSSCWS